MRLGAICLVVLSLVFAPMMVGCGGGDSVKKGDPRKPSDPTKAVSSDPAGGASMTNPAMLKGGKAPGK